MKRYCKDCVHYDVCPERKICEDYYHCNDTINDREIEKMVEEGREEFREDWLLYISGWDD